MKAACEYLRPLPQVDPKRIGIYGGSYGGFLTALALARDSGVFAAGVDIHGVHNWAAERAHSLLENRYQTAPNPAVTSELRTQNSGLTISASAKHRSVRRLEKVGVPFDELVIPDEHPSLPASCQFGKGQMLLSPLSLSVSSE